MNDRSKSNAVQKAVFGGGCFWCTEAVFGRLKGVSAVRPGYAGGTTPNPTYEEVCGGATGHVEVIEIEFDPALITYRDLLTVFFATHDPTTMNRQGSDSGTQYASVIFFTTEEQSKEAESYVAEINAENVFERPVVTRIEPLSAFYEAEDYHRDYYQRNSYKPYCELVISPKIAKLHERFEQLLKKE